MLLRSALLVLTVLAAVPVAAQEEKNEGRLLTKIRQLTFEGRRAGEGYFSRDGSQMIFQSEREPGNPFYQIYLMDLETGDVERMSPGMGKTTCSWIHPDKSRVLFASTHADPKSKALQDEEIAIRNSGKQRRYAWDYDEHFEIWDRDLKTGEMRNLSNARGYDAEGSWSPDGKLIAFASNRTGYTEKLSEADQQRFAVDKSLFMEIYVMNADGSNVRRITHARGYDGGPFFNHDGTKICWRRFSEDGLTAEIYTANIDGSEMRCLTRMGAMSWAPYFHPSGRYLIYNTNVHGFGNFELYLVDPMGRGEPVRVTYTDKFDGLANWTPDGKTLSWTSQRTRAGTSQIFLAEWNHEEALRLVEESVAKASAAGSVSALPSADLGLKKTAAITPVELEAEVRKLCSDEMDGRQTGTEGERKATAYVAARFQTIGLKPGAPGGGWFQDFSFVLPGKGEEPDREVRGRNVLAYLPAAQDTGLPAIVIGAHLDHLGRGAENSRARADEKGHVHHGADDNASGVAAMIEAAEYLKGLQDRGKLKNRRSIVFAAWSAEEMGLHGSKAYLEAVAKLAGEPDSLRGSIAANLNLDMIGRMKDELLVSGVGSSSVWPRVLERRNAPVGLPLSLNEDSNLPTDSTSFNLRGVPALTFFTGAHDDYHTPRDTPDLLDYESTARIARLVALIARGLSLDAEAPEFKEQQAASAGRGRPTARKAWLGSIPDYAKAPIPGLKLSGVAPGGPCAKAGMKAGDIVVMMAGKDVKDIYSYAEILETLKPGVEIAVAWVRGSTRLEGKLTPGERE